MRILAIRGENLASLAAPFALEFEREPLRSAGLFAIAGETGAGKSTILDALCLALYDDFPRVVAPGGSEEVPDASGERIKENDPRTILRRGAARGFAEVDFSGRDGRLYRARCDLTRARGRASGRLQNRIRSLWRIDESGEIVEAVESGVEAVNRRVAALTDLTFDQFRRTALLAQGDFDAFLRAKPNERADLLEKITGAEIYGLLSRRAYEKTREAGDRVKRLEEALAEIGAMTEEARAGLLTEKEALVARRAALDAAQQEVVEALRRLAAHEQAAAKLAQAEADHAAAAQALDALAQERERRDALERVEPLRGPRDETQKARSQLAEKEAAAARATEVAGAARVAVDAAQEKLRLAVEALEASAVGVEQMKPLWEKAAELDALIDGQKREVARAGAAETEATTAAAAKAALLAQARAEERTAATARDAAHAARGALDAARPLGERWPEIDAQLTKRARALGEKREAADLLRKAEEALAQARKMCDAFDLADAHDRAALADALAQRGERAAARDALDAPAARRRLAEAMRALDMAQALARLSHDHDAAQEKMARAKADAARFGEEVHALAAALAELQAQRAAQVLQKEEAERLGELADAAADPHALRLRATLEDGEACPVCGATDHPFAEARDAASELVSALRAKRDAARRTLEATEAAMAEKGAGEARARARCEEATQRRGEAQAAIERAAQDYARRLAREPLDGAPAAIADAAEGLHALIAQAETLRVGQEQIIETAERLGADIERLGKAAEGWRAAMDARRVMREEEETRARRAGEDRARLGEVVASATRELAALDEALASYLALGDLATADLDRDPDGARRRLAESGAKFKEAEAALADAEQRLAETARRAASLDVEARAEAGIAASAVADHGARRGELARLEAEREQLLGGEETARHRARVEEKHNAARLFHDAAKDALASADKAKAACDARSAAAAAERETARDALETRKAAFAAALLAAGLTAQEADPLLSVSPQEAQAMRQRVDTAMAGLASAVRALDERRADLAEATEGLPETPRAELETMRTEGAAEIEEVLTRLGALQQHLAQDDAARARAAALTGDIKESRALSKTWEEINAAIGSREGDKFRRFAQSVTLEQLVALANQRLALLAPRYRLERAGEMGALGLQIVDRDLGDERRSTRSLSGGERFLASLALALALAGLEGRDSFVDTLFIDEGFGALDAGTLDVAIDALENLQGQGRKVGVISHVESLQSRIATKICVERRGGGVSVVRLRAPGLEAAEAAG
ncbi:AAA family ATPase [Methylocystis sp. IM3]|uniref:AAA family ATPase n=1 Tax=unclassified Methylocystis TaxID=2625913 RepID=UPI0030F957B5